MTPAPRASIVIVTYGQRELTEQCLRSLERCLGERLGRDWELVLIDNNSPDDTPALLRGWSDRAIVRLLEENRNFAGGCNLGAAEAHGDVLIFLNNDTEVLPGALETIVEQALEPGVSVAGCRLLFPDGTLQHAGVVFIQGEALGGAPMPQHVFHHQDQELASSAGSYELDCVTAACMAVRASTFRAVGGFDEGYRNGLEDVDLCLRIRLTGERIVYRGDVTVIHHEGASRGRGVELWATPERLAAMHSNDQRFTSRWASQLGQDDELAALVWDAGLHNRPRPRGAPTADVALVGQPGGIGPAADESRALLAAITAGGRIVAAFDWPAPTVVPRLTGAIAALVADAQRRAPSPTPHLVMVPSGAHDSFEVRGPMIVRLARPHTTLPLRGPVAVWACSRAVAAGLIDQGLPPERVAIVPPPVLPAPLGEGGGGVLAILPVHAPDQARLLLEALKTLPPSTDVRLLPTVGSRHLARHIAEILPRAELLGPCSDEARFAALAADADVVVAIDGSDRFERRALVAAGVGAAPITGNPTGPAADVLGAGVAEEPGQLGAALTSLLADPGVRPARARRVHEACSLDMFVRASAAAAA